MAMTTPAPTSMATTSTARRGPSPSRTSSGSASASSPRVPARSTSASSCPARCGRTRDRIAHIAPRFAGIVREVRKQTSAIRSAPATCSPSIESENLATYELKAAFDGIVIDRHIAPGEAVDARARRRSSSPTSRPSGSTSASTRTRSPQVSLGQPVRHRRRATGRPTPTGTVSYVAPIVDQATRTATRARRPPEPGRRVAARALRHRHGLRPGRRRAVVVPRRALQTLRGRRPSSSSSRATASRPRPVTVGRAGASRVEIAAGLVAGERFADERLVPREGRARQGRGRARALRGAPCSSASSASRSSAAGSWSLGASPSAALRRLLAARGSRSTPCPTSPTARCRSTPSAPSLSPGRGREAGHVPDRDGARRHPRPRLHALALAQRLLAGDGRLRRRRRHLLRAPAGRASGSRRRATSLPAGRRAVHGADLDRARRDLHVDRRVRAPATARAPASATASRAGSRTAPT